MNSYKHYLKKKPINDVLATAENTINEIELSSVTDKMLSLLIQFLSLCEQQKCVCDREWNEITN